MTALLLLAALGPFAAAVAQSQPALPPVRPPPQPPGATIAPAEPLPQPSGPYREIDAMREVPPLGRVGLFLGAAAPDGEARRLELLVVAARPLGTGTGPEARLYMSMWFRVWCATNGLQPIGMRSYDGAGRERPNSSPPPGRMRFVDPASEKLPDLLFGYACGTRKLGASYPTAAEAVRTIQGEPAAP